MRWFNRLSSSFELSWDWNGEDRLVISKTFWRPLVRLTPSFWLGLYLDGEDFPVFLRTFWGFLRSALAGLNLLPFPGAVGA